MVNRDNKLYNIYEGTSVWDFPDFIVDTILISDVIIILK